MSSLTLRVYFNTSSQKKERVHDHLSQVCPLMFSCVGRNVNLSLWESLLLLRFDFTKCLAWKKNNPVSHHFSGTQTEVDLCARKWAKLYLENQSTFLFEFPNDGWATTRKSMMFVKQKVISSSWWAGRVSEQVAFQSSETHTRVRNHCDLYLCSSSLLRKLFGCAGRFKKA